MFKPKCKKKFVSLEFQCLILPGLPLYVECFKYFDHSRLICDKLSDDNDM